jgi:protein-S-isoprenylcysteine O-methyltransferase Ste14
MLILTILLIFLTIFIEFLNLYIQFKWKLPTKWFGNKAFAIHKNVIGILWAITFFFIVFLQLKTYPIFHQSIFLKYLGIVFLFTGIIIAVWAFKLLGIKRSSHLNFFEENVPIVKESLYKYIKDPEYLGFWLILTGLTIFTASLYNLIITIEFIILMLPLTFLENKTIT